MKDSRDKVKFLSSITWSLLGQIIYLVIGFITNIILARLLSPVEFGKIGIIMFFIIIAKVISESGLAGALVRRNDLDENDYSTVFIFNFLISLILVIILIIFSGFISNFYNDTELKLILITSSFVIIVNAFKITQNVKLIKNMQFGRKAVYEISSVLLSSLLGIVLALSNYGVWSIVYMQLSNSLFLVILLWSFEGPLKSLKFDINAYTKLAKFGIYTTITTLISSIYDNIYQLIIGKYFNINQSGYYYQGKRLQEIPFQLISSIIYGPIFSTFSKIQNDHNQFISLYKRLSRTFTVIIGLICLLIFFYADIAIDILFGQKWIHSAFYVRILVFSSFFYMQEVFNSNLFKVFNKTEKILHLEIIKKLISTIAIVLGVYSHNIEYLLYSFSVVSILSFLINYYYSNKIFSIFKRVDFYFIIFVLLFGGISNIIGCFFLNLCSPTAFASIIFSPFLVFFYFLFLYIFKLYNVSSEISLVRNLLIKD